MLNSYPIVYNPPGNNLRRNSLHSNITLTKSRRNSFSPSTFEEFHDNFFSEPKDDANLSFLDGLDLANNHEHLTLPELSAPSPIISSSSVSPQSNIQCVRIIRRTDSAPIPSTSNPTNQRRVVRVIRLSNTPSIARSTTESTSTSNVYIVRKNDLPPPPPSVQINPALKHVIAKANTSNPTDENNQINKFYGSTISIFGIEFTVVSNETNNNTDQCASLVQNMPETTTTTAGKSNGSSTNKVLLFLSLCQCERLCCLDQWYS